jgi:multicomponent Na+:H+ antiporter subunit D
VYSIIRTETVIFPGTELNPALLIIALLTMVVGVLGAVAQADIKRLLSFTLVSHIGYMILGVALGTAEGTSAAIFYIVHHIIVQSTLFLAVGLVERQGGTTSINKLGGLLAASPLIAVMFFIPALNLGGIPPFSGFLGKIALFQATAAQGTPLGYVLIAAGALVSLLTLYALVRVWNMAFWRSPAEVKDYESPLLSNISEAPFAKKVAKRLTIPPLMLGATGAMVAVSVALTVFAGPLYGISSRAGENLEGPSYYVDTIYPHGIPTSGTGETGRNR